VGRLAETAATEHLRAIGWGILGRNVRIGRDEIDIIALEPGPVRTIVVVEVRSRSGHGFGDGRESVDARKVARLYRSASSLRRRGFIDHLVLPDGTDWRIDLLSLVRDRGGSWSVAAHIRGLEPP
jgi:Holliday junction resolvase-like predicted endonuclease